MARDDLPDVDFTLDAAAPWDDEDLPQSRERDWSRLGRLRRPLGVLAVVALAGLGVWKLGTLKGSDPNVADGSPSPSASTSVRPGDLAGAGITVRIPVAHRDGTLFSEGGPTCPEGLSCTTRSTLPPGVTAALRADYPGAKILSSQTVTVHSGTGHPLLSRSVHLTVGPQDITVEVLARSMTAGSGRTDSGQDSLVYVQRPNGHFTVRVTVVGPRSAKDVAIRAASVATDRRVIAVT